MAYGDIGYGIYWIQLLTAKHMAYGAASPMANTTLHP